MNDEAIFRNGSRFKEKLAMGSFLEELATNRQIHNDSIAREVLEVKTSLGI